MGGIANGGYQMAKGMYRIVRFRQHDLNNVVKVGLTLEEAQEHCQREDTRGKGWFDGYEEVQTWYYDELDWRC